MFCIWEIFALISKCSSDFSFSSWSFQALFCKLYLVLFDVYEGIFHKKLESSLAHCELKWTELSRLRMFSHHTWTTVRFCWFEYQLFFLKRFLSCALDNNHTNYLIPYCSRLLGYLLNYKKNPVFTTLLLEEERDFM